MSSPAFALWQLFFGFAILTVVNRLSGLPSRLDCFFLEFLRCFQRVSTNQCWPTPRRCKLRHFKRYLTLRAHAQRHCQWSLIRPGAGCWHRNNGCGCGASHCTHHKINQPIRPIEQTADSEYNKITNSTHIAPL